MMMEKVVLVSMPAAVRLIFLDSRWMSGGVIPDMICRNILSVGYMQLITMYMVAISHNDLVPKSFYVLSVGQSAVGIGSLSG